MRMFCIMSSLLLPCCPVRFPHNWFPSDSPMSWFTVKMTSLTTNKKSIILQKLICHYLSRSHSPMGKWVRDGGASSNVSKSSLTWPSSLLWLLSWCPGDHVHTWHTSSSSILIVWVANCSVESFVGQDGLLKYEVFSDPSLKSSWSPLSRTWKYHKTSPSRAWLRLLPLKINAL